MAFTVMRDRPTVEKHPPSLLRVQVAPRRRPALLAGSAVLLTACTALFASAYLKAGHQVPVLGISHAVPQGAVITSSDLTVVRLAVSGLLEPVPASESSQVVGRRAAVGLVPGSLLTMAEVASGSPVPPDAAIVGVSVKQSQLPAEGVSVGERVDIVLTGIPGSPAFAATGMPATSSGGQSAQAMASPLGNVSPVVAGAVIAGHVIVTAFTPGTAANGDAIAVSVLVPATVAPVVATASAAGQVALVAVGD